MISAAQPSVHPDLEELAALVDRRLPPDRAAAVRRHLGECADCYELVVGASLTEEELAGGAASLAPIRPLLPWILAAAAAVAAAAIGLGLLRAFVLVPTDVVAMASRLDREPLEGAPFPTHDWPVYRSLEQLTPEERAALLRIGVRAVDLQVALAAGDAETAAGVARHAASQVEGVEFADFLAQDYERLAGELAAGAIPPDAEARARQVLDDLASILEDDAVVVELGFAAEAARLAAAAGDDPARHRWLRALRRAADDATGDPYLAEVLAEHLPPKDAPPPTAAELHALIAALGDD